MSADVDNNNIFDFDLINFDFPLGCTDNGEQITANLANINHLVISGVSGSGKSFFLHSLIQSLSQTCTPNALKFIIIDTSLVEYHVYNPLPHMLVPVITSQPKIFGAIAWLATEAHKRLHLFSEIGAKTIQEYNDICWEYFDEADFIPHISIIIDDFSHITDERLFMPLQTLLQSGRITGIHLILSAQSLAEKHVKRVVEQIPNRLVFSTFPHSAFKFLTNSEKQYDLSEPGAALFVSGSASFTRIKTNAPPSPSIEDITKKYTPNHCDKYSDSATAELCRVFYDETPEPNIDEMFSQAVEVAVDIGQISVSLLQRKLKLGYSRAARLVDQMEEKGIVGPFEGSKPRQVLISKQQWQEMQFINNTAPVTPKPEPEPGQTMHTAEDLFNENNSNINEIDKNINGKVIIMKKPKTMQCKTCGGTIAKDADTCPHCGAKRRPGCIATVLATLAMFVGVIVIFSVIFGGGSSSPEKLEYGIGEAAEYNDVIATLLSVKESKGSSYNRPDDGQVFLICEMEIQNNSNSNVAVSSIASFTCSVDGYMAEYSLGALLEGDSQQLDGAIEPGKKMRGVVGFQAPKDWEELELSFDSNVWKSSKIKFIVPKDKI